MTAMKFTLPLALCLGTVSLAAGPAHASSSAWFETDGGRFRLVTSGQPDASGKLQGVLDIELKPGWKTYWRDPGNSGVPPQIDLSASSNVSGAEISYPAPQRHDDGYAKWAGYDFPVRLPVSFTVPAPGEPTAIKADVFLGICETICVPVQARLEIDPAADPANAGDAALVTAALAALPSGAQPDFGATLSPARGETISIAATAPGDPEGIDLFLAGVDGYQFGTPERHEQAGKLTFSLKVIDRPATKPAGKGIPYTLTSSGGAVEGYLAYP
ncbi:protein-disulfide reductase DsbD domain-containing protein [Aminobacter sp. NyZ550]|uniref:protein-disulfide reductase DsbD domain-containing protein n=1 Tax=Aminobacter sp. NyZ550 TaxID=2979870 RepID=UPI003FA439CA